jgi:hypothetical protein
VVFLKSSRKAHPLLLRLVWTLFLIFSLAPNSRAQSDPQEEYRANLARAKTRLTSANVLAQKVHDIATSGEISSAKKDKRISTAVRVAVVAATAYKSDPDVILGIALQMAEAAARAAPRYAQTISNAVAFAPSVSRIEGAQNRIRIAAFAAAKGPKIKRARSLDYAVSVPAPKENDEAMPAESEVAQSPPPPEAEAPARPRIEAPEPVQPTAEATPPAAESAEASPDQMQNATPAEDNQGTVTQRRPAASNIAQGENSKLTATANLGVQRDDNVYFSNSNKVSDTIYSVEPGLNFQFGQNSLDHGLLNYQENFLRYAKHTAPNVSLASVNGDFGYDDGSIKLTAVGNYQQLFQNNIDVLTIGPQALIRSDVYNLDGTGEIQIGGSTSASVGVDYNHTVYGLPTLLSSEDISFPLNFYYKITPKVDLSAGYTFGVFRPLSAGPDAKDGYANVGARGDFTQKLSGSVSVGYITRSFDSSASVPQSAQTQSTHSLGFTGNLNYEVTPKTSANLSFARSFNASALAQTTTYSTYSLSFNTEVSPQWSVGESLSEQLVDYGPQVFFVQNTLPTGNRKDNLGTVNLHLSYIYSRWLTGTIAYTFRNDHSTISAIDFSDDVFSLTLGLSY